jgi:hypothetical protein
MRRNSLYAALWLCGVLSVAGMSAAAGVPVHEATQEQRQEAQKSFEIGSKRFDAKRYGEALEAFQASYDVVRSPNTRLMIARCLRELNRPREAYAEFTGTVAEVTAIAEKDERYAKTLEAAQAELDALKAKTALLKVSILGASGETEVQIGDLTLSSNELAEPIALPPGKTTVSAANASGERVERTLDLKAGEAAAVDLDLSVKAPPPASPPPEPVAVEATTSGTPLRTLAYVAGGVGVAGLATFTVFGIMNNSKYGDLQDTCPDNRCPTGVEDDIDTGKTYQTIANVGLIVGGVGLAAGAVLFVMSTGESEGATGAQASRTELTLGPGYVGVRGRF